MMGAAVGVWSLAPMKAVPTPSAMRTSDEPVMAPRLRWKYSLPSSVLSSTMLTVTRWLVWPAAKVTEPLAAVKSVPAAAVPSVVL